MSTAIRNTPGVSSFRRYDPVNIFVDPCRVEYAPSFAFIDGTNSRDTGNSTTSLLRPGLVMGKTTTSGKYRPFFISVTTADLANGATSITVSVAEATEISRLKTISGGGNLTLRLIGSPAAGGTVAVLTLIVTAVNTGTGVLTVSAISAAAIAGSIIAPADGAEVPVVPITNQTGIDVVDLEANSIDQPLPGILRKADLLTAKLPFYSSLNADTKAWLKTKMKLIGLYTFDDDR